MSINGNRLIDTLTYLKGITATPGRGVTRLSYSSEDLKVRKYIKEIANDLSFETKTDGIGNMLIVPPKSRARVLIGSHIDTVINGGWLDGIYGVISSLEVLRAFSEEGFSHDAALIIFAEEEGTNFGSTMTGSKFIAGKYGSEMLDSLKDDKGRSLRQLAERAGFRPEKDGVLDLSGADLMIETHIEQGPVLDDLGLDIGIVHTIFGQTTVEITISGLGNHAGASPMDRRKDALMAACEGILRSETLIKRDPGRRAVMTVGKIRLEPDCSNVIPEKAVFTLEVRDADSAKVSRYIEEIGNIMKETAKSRGTSCSIRDIASSDSVPMTASVVSDMDSLASEKGLSYQVMNSGAVHDTAMLTDMMDTGMIFVPSIDGRSHVPQEDTDPRQLVKGAGFLLDFIREKAGK